MNSSVCYKTAYTNLNFVSEFHFFWLQENGH